jgi:hypothetical protein
MITRLKLKPGQHGTKALVEKYGDALVCVRYRYDAEGTVRLKTVELVEEKKELKPPRQKIADDAIVPVRIAYAERELMKFAKAARGRWDPDVKLWYVSYGKIKGTELEQHMVLDANEKSGKKGPSNTI